MKDDAAKLIRKLKDADDQYLWQPGLQAGQPDTILGRPVIVSTQATAPAADAKSVIFGDMSYYTIADRAGISAQKLERGSTLLTAKLATSSAREMTRR